MLTFSCSDLMTEKTNTSIYVFALSPSRKLLQLFARNKNTRNLLRWIRLSLIVWFNDRYPKIALSQTHLFFLFVARSWWNILSARIDPVLQWSKTSHKSNYYCSDDDIAQWSSTFSLDRERRRNLLIALIFERYCDDEWSHPLWLTM